MRPSENILTALAEEESVEELNPLINQLGSASGLELVGNVNASFRLVQVHSLEKLRAFLEAYRAEILVLLELPLICSAFSHACRNEFAELIALDQSLAKEKRIKRFAAPSLRVGQMQLQRLRPLRDQRGLQRYLRAVDSGDAHGWHTLVFGVTLASFSCALRQGLMHYAEQVIRGFIVSASRTMTISTSEGEALVSEQISVLPPLIDSLLSESSLGSPFRIS